MNINSTISVLKEWIPQPALPWVVRGLKADPILWNALLDNKSLAKAISVTWSPETTLPVCIAIRCMDPPIVDRDYHEIRARKLPEEPRTRCFNVYETLLNDPSASTSLSDAGFLALGLFEHYRETKSWENPVGNIQSIQTPHHLLPDIWQTGLSCLFSLSNSSQQLLSSLHQLGVSDDAIIQMVLSNPQPFESHLEIFEQFINTLDVSSQLMYIKTIFSHYPDLAVRISEVLKPKEQDYESGFIDIPAIAKSVSDEAVLTEINAYSSPNQESLRAYLKIIEQNTELNTALTCSAANHAISSNQIQTGLRLSSRLVPPVTKKLVTPVSTLILSMFAHGLASEAADLNDRLFPKESSRRQYLENHPIILLNRSLIADRADDQDTAYSTLQQLMASINNRSNLQVLNGNTSLFFDSLLKLITQNQWHAELITAVQIAHEVDPDNPEYVKLSASLLRDQSDETQVNPMLLQSIDSLEYSTVLHPERIDLTQELASTLETAGDFRRALTERVRVIELQASPKVADLNALAYTAIKTGDYSKAEKAAKRALDIKPQHAPTHVCLANVYRQNKQYDLAEEYFNQAATISPDNEAIWTGLAELYHDLGDHQKEYQTLQTAVQANPDSAKILYQFGECSNENGRAEDILSIYQKALAAAGTQTSQKDIPLLTRIRLQIGKIYLQRQDFDQAEKILADAFADAPQHVTLAKNFADVLLKNGQTKKAIQPLAIVIQSEPEDPQVYLDYLHALIDSEVPSQEAFKVLETLKSIQPGLPEIIGYEAELLAAGGHHADAYKKYQKALESKLVDDLEWKARLVLGLGLTAMQINEPETALAALQAAKEVTPNSLEVNRALTDGYINSGLNGEAFQSALTTKSLAPDDIGNLAWFARKSIQLDENQQAIRAYQQAVELAPDRKDLELELAQAYHQQDQLLNAKEHYCNIVNDAVSGVAHLILASDGLMHLDQPQIAISGYQRAVEQSESSACGQDERVVLFNKLYHAYLATKDYPAALDVLDQSIAIHGSGADTIIKKIDLLIKMDRTQAALASIDRAVQENIAETSIYRYAARIHRQLGQIDEALGFVEQALIIAPDDLAAQGLASELTAACGNYLQAEKFLLDGKVIGQTDVDYHYTTDEILTYTCMLCELGLENNNEISAADALTTALEIYPDHPRVLGNQARMLTRKGDLESAVEALESALENIDYIQLGKPIRALIQDLEQRNTQFTSETYIAIGNAAMELHQWGPALFLLRKATALAPSEIRGHIELLKAIVRQAEYQYLYQELDSVRNAPGVAALSQNTVQEFKILLKSITDYKESAQSRSSTSPQVLNHDLEEWSVRGIAAFTKDEDNIQKLLQLTPTPINWAAGLRALRDSGKWIQAQEFALDLFYNYRRNAKKSPYLWGQIALTLTGENEEAAYKAAQLAHETSINPKTSDYPLYLVLKSRLLERSSNYAEAYQLMDRALSIWEDEPRWHSRAASLLKQNGKFLSPNDPESENEPSLFHHLEKACQLEPNNPRHYKFFGQNLLLNGDTERAIEALNHGIELDERDPELWIALADAHEGLNQIREANVMAKRAVDLDPKNVPAMLILARIALHQEKYQKAFKHSGFVLEREPENLEAMAIQAWSLSGIGKDTEAIHAIDAVLAENPADIDLVLERTEIINRTKGVVEARTALEKLLPNIPDHPKVQMMLSRLYLQEDHAAMAVQAAQKALASKAGQLSDTEKADLHLLLGQLLKKTGQLDQSLHHLTKSLEITPDSSKVMLEIGKTYQERKQYIEALQSYHNAINNAPEDPMPYYFAGQTYKAMREYPQAEDMLRKAVDRAPNDLNIHRQLGTVVAINLFQNRDMNSSTYKKSRA